MTKPIAVLVLVLCITANLICIASTEASSAKVFPLPEENGNVILADNASYLEEGTKYYYDNYTGLQTYIWYFPMFTTGNGTTNIYASAHNCNLTVNSYKQATTPMETEYMYNVSSSVDCTVTGGGVACINVIPFDAASLSVYLDGVLRQNGDGWNRTGGYLAIQGPANVIITSSEVDYWPPRDAPHDEYLYPTALITTVVVLVLAGAIVASYLRSKRKRRGTQQAS
jgi:hypothetical protein